MKVQTLANKNKLPHEKSSINHISIFHKIFSPFVQIQEALAKILSAKKG